MHVAEVWPISKAFTSTATRGAYQGIHYFQLSFARLCSIIQEYVRCC